MKNGFIKIALAAPKIRVADPIFNAGLCIDAAKAAAAEGAKVLLFPELVLSGATAGDLLFQSSLIKKCESALIEYAEKTAELDMISFVGFPIKNASKLYDAVAAVSKGEILGISTASENGKSRYFDVFGDSEEIKLSGREVIAGENIIYSLDGCPNLKIFVEIGNDAYDAVPISHFAAEAGANLILGAMAYPEYLGLDKKENGRALSVSERLACAYAVCSASDGESGTDGIFAGRRMICEQGDFICSSGLFSEDILYGVIDIEKSEAVRMKNNCFKSSLRGFCEVDFSLSEIDTNPAAPNKFPFIPTSQADREAASELALSMQARALAGRIERARAKRCVIGVSGGLDSTLAVLVCERAMRLLKREVTDVIAITMPCFGTSERTKSNALSLAEELGLTVRTIDIKDAVNQHFRDIGHSEDCYDVVYENAQARERTQILMDVANAEGGIVVGTGDLSELALGFATYNGDQMSMYSVNGSIPKTLMREIIRCSAKNAYKRGAENLAKVLLDVIETPVSPELLPTENGKENAQYTETIVGPYELHDFFLYYTVKYGFGAEKIKRLACLAFEGKYGDEEIGECLKRFFSRFVTQQFKRSCMPDGPKITEISLSPRCGLMMPSDASAAFICEDL